jgi:hypothetical protein
MATVERRMEEQFTLTNEPVPATPADYDRARRWMVEYLSARDDVRALFEYGSVRVPGLSDLDFIVVLANQPARDIARYLDRQCLHENVASRMDGATLMIMSEADFPYVVRWDDVCLTQHYGKPLDVVRIEERALHYIESCRIVDWLPWHAARLARIINTKEIPIRRTLGLLYSLTYSVRRLHERFGFSMPRWQDYVMKTLALREHWFDDPVLSCEKLLRLVHEAQQIVCEALDVFGRYVTVSGLYGSPDTGPDRYLRVPGGTLLHFVPDFQFNTLSDIIHHSSEKNVVVPLPGVLFRHFAAYAAGDGLISRMIRKTMIPAVAVEDLSVVDPGMMKVLNERIDVCNRWASFLRTNRFKSGLFKFAWFYDHDLA